MHKLQFTRKQIVGKLSENCHQEVNNNKGPITKAAQPFCTNANLFIDKTKKGKSANLRPSLEFYGMIKSQHLCNGMTILP